MVEFVAFAESANLGLDEAAGLGVDVGAGDVLVGINGSSKAPVILS